MGQHELFGKWQRIHIVGPCEHMLGSYATGSNRMGQHEGVVTQYIFQCLGPFEIIGTGKHIHIVGQCGCLLSYATGPNCMGQ